MTYMLLLNCALKLVEEIILYYDARSKKHQIKLVYFDLCKHIIYYLCIFARSICCFSYYSQYKRLISINSINRLVFATVVVWFSVS